MRLNLSMCYHQLAEKRPLTRLRLSALPRLVRMMLVSKKTLYFYAMNVAFT